MGYFLKEVGEETNVSMKRYYCDTEIEKNSITNCPLGTELYVIESGILYIADSNGQWYELQKGDIE